MNTETLTRLAQQAQAWAKCYTALVEALLREGVPEATAREEARAATTMAVLLDDPADGDDLGL